MEIKGHITDLGKSAYDVPDFQIMYSISIASAISQY